MSVLKKNDNSFYFNFFSLSVFHWYKRKSCRNTNIEGYFHFSSKWSLFSKMLSFLKEVFSVFEKCQILMALFLFGKKYHFMQKVFVFGQRSEFLSTVIKSSHAKLWGKVTSVFLNINFLCKTVNFLGKKIEILWEILTFSNNCALLVSVNILLENMLIFRKFWLFVWMSLYIKKLSKYDKNFNFS